MPRICSIVRPPPKDIALPVRVDELIQNLIAIQIVNCNPGKFGSGMTADLSF